MAGKAGYLELCDQEKPKMGCADKHKCGKIESESDLGDIGDQMCMDKPISQRSDSDSILPHLCLSAHPIFGFS